jgi:beta-lactamase regulating signal transducer with metallopeptidase domain
MLLAWMAYSVLFGVITYAAALAADRVAATWGRSQRFVWLTALIIAVAVPVVLATRPRIEPASVGVGQPGPEIDVTLVSTHAVSTATTTETVRARVERAIGAADPFVLRVWLLASLVWLAVLVRAAIGVRRRRVHWRAVEIDGTAVLVSPGVGPAVIGALAPRVVIPQWALTLDAPARALMLRHEREHIRARDPLLLLGAALATMLAPWNAALWLLVRRLRLAIEIDCDQRVLRASAQRREYGELLLTVGARKGAPLPFATSLAERRPFLERRIKAMTTSNPRYPRLISAACMILVAAATTAAMRAPHPSSLITQQQPAAPKSAAPVIESPSVTPPTAVTPALEKTVASLPTSTLVPPVLETPAAKPIEVVAPALEPPRLRRGPDSLSVEEIRKMISEHHASALNGDPDINTITLVVDARGNYVTSLAESRPFAMGFVGARGSAGGFAVAGGGRGGSGDAVAARAGSGGGVVYARGGASAAGDSATLEEKTRRLKALMEELNARMAERANDTITAADRDKKVVIGEQLARAKLELENSQRLGEVLGMNMNALSQIIDPETMESTRVRTFQPGQLGTTALRVFIVRLKP